MIKKYHVSAQYGNTWNPKSYAKFISGTQTYNKFPITLRTTQQSIPTWSVKGNMVQNGVPSSTSPITPQETGERTENLCNPIPYKNNYYINENGVETQFNGFDIYKVTATAQTEYTLSLNTSLSGSTVRIHSYSNGSWVEQTTTSTVQTLPITFTTPQDCDEIRFSITHNALNHIMYNTGSTPLPYQPHGYKLDIKSGSTTIPVYLGQVQSERQIKKYECTGQEAWVIGNYPKPGTYQFYIPKNVYFPDAKSTIVSGESFCTHFLNQERAGGIAWGANFNIYMLISDLPEGATVNDFKAYLATQYAAGTPVTVWYPLATSTTGIVNEPLRKIGNYADSITNPVSLPTTLGLNTIDVNTTLKPSEMSLTYNGYKVCKSTKIQQVTREVDFVNNTKSLTGSVDNLKVYQLMNRCNVSDNGTITAYYGDPNYTEDGSNGQVMVYVKKFYYKLDVSQPGDLSGINIRKGRWSISDIPIEGYKLHPAFLAADGVTELPYFLYGAFDAVGQDSNGIYSSSYNTTSYKLSSVGGNTYKPICSLTRATARTMATNRGNGWYQVGVKQTMAIQMLFAVEFGFNSQVAVGRGIVNDTGTHNTGLTIGNKTSGTYDNATTAVNYRGIENLWGNIINFIDGINISNTTPYICNTFTFSDNTSTDYTRISFILPGINYTTAFGYDSDNDWVLLPSETNRSTVDEFGPIGDYFGSNSDWRVARLGGSYIYGRDAGLFYWDCHYNSSYTDVGVGSRLMYIPQTA